MTSSFGNILNVSVGCVLESIPFLCGQHLPMVVQCCFSVLPPYHFDVGPCIYEHSSDWSFLEYVQQSYKSFVLSLFPFFYHRPVSGLLVILETLSLFFPEHHGIEIILTLEIS